MQKTPGTVVEAEQLNLLIGSIPLRDEEKDGVKANILALLNEKYGIKEINVVSVDSVLSGMGVDYIKYDVEGSEREALLGASLTIKKYAIQSRTSPEQEAPVEEPVEEKPVEEPNPEVKEEPKLKPETKPEYNEEEYLSN